MLRVAGIQRGGGGGGDCWVAEAGQGGRKKAGEGGGGEVGRRGRERPWEMPLGSHSHSSFLPSLAGRRLLRPLARPSLNL